MVEYIEVERGRKKKRKRFTNRNDSHMVEEEGW